MAKHKGSRNYKKRKLSTEQIAFYCKDAAEASSKGLDVHREYLKQTFAKLNSTEKHLVNIAMKKIADVEGEEQIELLKKIKEVKTADEFIKTITEGE